MPNTFNDFSDTRTTNRAHTNAHYYSLLSTLRYICHAKRFVGWCDILSISVPFIHPTDMHSHPIAY